MLRPRCWPCTFAHSKHAHLWERSDLCARTPCASRAHVICSSCELTLPAADRISGGASMPTADVLQKLQDLYMADDVDIPPEATGWSEAEAEAFFESGGEVRPASRDAASAPSAAASMPPPPPQPLPPSAPEPTKTPGAIRWYVDISKWEPSEAEWRLLVGIIPKLDAERVMKFKFVADQKRALLSRLLQRRACFEVAGVAYGEVAIERTKGGKPFMSNKTAAGARSAPTNWNFNVSHEGMYVVLASEPTMLCGVDVAAPEEHRAGKKKKSIRENLRLMEGQLTPAEMLTINMAAPDERKMEDLFRRFWSLKEAYTKARGDGLGFELKRCDFQLGETSKGASGQPVQLATLKVDGKPMRQWGFYVQDLSEGHWISVARGEHNATRSPSAQPRSRPRHQFCCTHTRAHTHGGLAPGTKTGGPHRHASPPGRTARPHRQALGTLTLCGWWPGSHAQARLPTSSTRTASSARRLASRRSDRQRSPKSSRG